MGTRIMKNVKSRNEIKFISSPQKEIISYFFLYARCMYNDWDPRGKIGLPKYRIARISEIHRLDFSIESFQFFLSVKALKLSGAFECYHLCSVNHTGCQVAEVIFIF